MPSQSAQVGDCCRLLYEVIECNTRLHQWRYANFECASTLDVLHPVVSVIRQNETRLLTIYRKTRVRSAARAPGENH